MLPRGIRNHNPCNIKKNKTKWQGLKEQQDDPVFFQFERAEDGIRAAARVIRTYGRKYGIKTIEGLVSRWAPATENATKTYVDFVERYVGISKDTIIQLDDPLTVQDLVKAIIHFENGEQPYSGGVIARAVQAGLNG
jgi:hypothetical protein